MLQINLSKALDRKSILLILCSTTYVLSQGKPVNLEIEIKLLIDDATIPIFKNHPMLQRLIQPMYQQRLISTYFDTPTKQLRRMGYALRIRQHNERLIQTLKGPAENHKGIDARQEWETPITEFVIDPNLIPIKKVSDLFNKPKFLENFGAQFVTDFTRTIWDIELSDKTVIEIALDQGNIIAGEHRTPLQEIELELKAGHAETLKALSTLFCTELGLTPEKRSKAARGFALLHETD